MKDAIFKCSRACAFIFVILGFLFKQFRGRRLHLIFDHFHLIDAGYKPSNEHPHPKSCLSRTFNPKPAKCKTFASNNMKEKYRALNGPTVTCSDPIHRFCQSLLFLAAENWSRHKWTNPKIVGQTLAPIGRFPSLLLETRGRVLFIAVSVENKCRVSSWIHT